ncbi:hypothetical protein NONI108955_41115 [Nocardia ninae]|uniref:Resolvase/invertase-type recombinase catalytic domain-containing protein n=1 Tax=Nocardia ninae NBRC 108245 TaxID=1210091 RepID=A0A511MG13_9NOCA|nr:hypothetical protein [Nocardia ninae]GEM39017.1 hypothetical protein NN4_35360 [Nocardia ninae NBRC 108245]
MTLKPIAVGYLRRDIAGVAQPWNETQIRSLARRLGYNLAKTVVFGASTAHPVPELIEAARRAKADAVIVPSVTHFDGNAVPGELTRVVDVVTVSPEETYARWSLNPTRWSDHTPDPT